MNDTLFNYQNITHFICYGDDIWSPSTEKAERQGHHEFNQDQPGLQSENYLKNKRQIWLCPRISFSFLKGHLEHTFHVTRGHQGRQTSTLSVPRASREGRLRTFSQLLEFLNLSVCQPCSVSRELPDVTGRQQLCQA